MASSNSISTSENRLWSLWRLASRPRRPSATPVRQKPPQGLGIACGGVGGQWAACVDRGNSPTTPCGKSTT